MQDEKYLIVDKETGEVIKEKSKYGPFRHIFSCLILFILFAVLTIIVSLIYRLLLWFWGGMLTLPRVFTIILGLLLGTTTLGIILAPLYYGAPALTMLSESIAPTRKGARYIVFSAISFLFCVYVVVSNLVIAHSLSLVYIYMAIVAIVVGFVGVSVSKED